MKFFICKIKKIFYGPEPRCAYCGVLFFHLRFNVTRAATEGANLKTSVIG